MSLIKEYLKLTEQHKLSYGELTIIFMQNGAFFEIYSLRDENNNYYGSNILDFSKICDLNIVDRKSQGNCNVIVDNHYAVNAGFKTHLVDKYVKKMQDSGYTILIYEEDENKNKYPNEKITRSLTETYSPGTYISSEQDNLSNNICCIWIETKKVRSKKINKTDVFIGISSVDIYTGKTIISEYKEEWIKSPTTFDELERFISTYNPSEIIIIYNITTNDINDIISYCNIKCKSLHLVDLVDLNIQNIDPSSSSKIATRVANVEKQTYQYEILNKFYKIVDMSAFMNVFNENVYASQSFCYLLDFIYQHNPNLINKLFEPSFSNNTSKLILANHSLKQLNIIDDDNYKGKYSSVSKMLNVCITTMGKREFNNIFLNPITDVNYLNGEYNIVEYLLENKNNYDFIKSTLLKINDLSKINRQVLLKKSPPKIIHQLYNSILNSQEIYNFIFLNDPKLTAYLEEKIQNFQYISCNFNEIIKYINDKLIIDKCQYVDNIQKIDENFICFGVSDVLDEQVKKLLENQDKLNAFKNYFNTVLQGDENANSKKTKSIKTVKATKATKATKTKPPRQVIGVDVLADDVEDEMNDDDISDEMDDNVDKKQFIKIHMTEKNNVGLVSPNKRCKTLETLLKLNKHSHAIELSYTSSYHKTEQTFTIDLSHIEFATQSSANKYIINRQITEICNSLTYFKNQIASTIKDVFLQIVNGFEEYTDAIENICAFVKMVDLVYAKMYIAHKFNYCKPVIQSQNVSKSFVNVTGLRHCLIEKIQQSELYVTNDLCIGDGNMNGMLLYGTNAVGKTSIIKALGISIIMAQAGLYVPASSFEYKPYEYIFTRILGNDNIFKGLSTFAVEMSELRTILKLANENSLVLGDELCSGTESTSATSIFVSGIQYLSGTNCSFIFATHLHEILDYDEINELDKLSIKHMSVIYNNETGCLEYDRKLKDGAGNNMYGLEVCKSLHLPEIFLENAHNIRMKYHPVSKSILDHKSSHFNAKKIIGMCEMCNVNIAKEVHHLQYQNEANEMGIINKNDLIFHKNL